MKKLFRHCLVLDLKQDHFLIEEYKNYHKKVWPEIIKSIKDSGIEKMEIYNLSNRLFMIMEVNEDFSFEKKASLDVINPQVQKWEELMWKYQQAIPGSASLEKWRIMEKIFDMSEY